MKIRLTLLPVPETRIGDLTMYIPSRRLLSPSYQKSSQWQIFEHTMPACKYNPFEIIPAFLEWCLTQFKVKVEVSGAKTNPMNYFSCNFTVIHMALLDEDACDIGRCDVDEPVVPGGGGAQNDENPKDVWCGD
ncbi:hypothetical protein M9H77_21197 [Catharanthus roseus]|uniref:Uncharacterized protein n=1 Tax=Catharanthus roseus TaxID=4058 RepID=A0ACC0ANZ6_CATRO|nr:hypothetical protein M9H77_21197 [Catharanthus roseus]